MNSKKMIVAALLLSGFAINAKGNFPLTDDAYDAPAKSGLSFRKSTHRTILKLNSQSLSSARDWDENEVNGGGLFLNFGIHFMSSNFLNPDKVSGGPNWGLGYDFEFGNYFRFAKLADEKVGIGLRATWLSLSYGSTKDGQDIYRVAQICPLKVGPQVGVAINEMMGVDLFYQLGYNLTEEFGSIYSPGNSKNIGQSSTFMGVSHEIGVAYHFKVFSLGLGYRFGKLKNTLNYYDGKQLDSSLLDDKKDPINNFRITLGFKF